jgi:CDP-glucose 4,6-dehydratase
MFANAYEGKRVFITGHTGFKGSWLASWLLRLGAELAGFSDCAPTGPSNFEAQGLAGRMRDIRGDVRDRNALCAAMRDFAPDMVFHLAAQALVRASYQEPAFTFETNAMGTMNLLEAVRGAPSVQAVVCITSDKCYRNVEWVWGYRERDQLGGDDPYSASKGCAELVAHSYFVSFFKDGPACATTRAGNVIGGGDWAQDRIVPDCARAWSEGRAARIRSPHATRPWQHVLEPLSGYLWLGARLISEARGARTLSGEAYNFGPAGDTDKTVSEVVDALAPHWPGFRSEMDRTGEPGMRESTLLKLCCDKALACLGWKATLDFEECIRYTAEWYRAYYAQDRPDMRAFTLGQIAAYSTAAEARGLPWTA